MIFFFWKGIDEKTEGESNNEDQNRKKLKCENIWYIQRTRISPVIQRFRIRIPMQRTWVRSWLGTWDPTCLREAEGLAQLLSTHAPELALEQHGRPHATTRGSPYTAAKTPEVLLVSAKATFGRRSGDQTGRREESGKKKQKTKNTALFLKQWGIVKAF